MRCLCCCKKKNKTTLLAFLPFVNTPGDSKKQKWSRSFVNFEKSWGQTGIKIVLEEVWASKGVSSITVNTATHTHTHTHTQSNLDKGTWKQLETILSTDLKLFTHFTKTSLR